MQLHSDSNNVEEFYRNLRQICGPSADDCSPLLSKGSTLLITDKLGILERIKKHVSGLLIKPLSSSADALVGISQRPILEEFDLPPKMEEI